MPVFTVFLALTSCGSTRGLGGARSVAARETMRMIPAGAVSLRLAGGGWRREAVRAFAIDRAPVTVRDFADYTATSGRAPPPADAEEGIDAALLAAHAFSGREPPRRYLAHPMVGVSLDEARAFCQWRGARVPTEAEWTRAVYGEGERAFPWGDLADATRTNSSEFGAGDTAPVLTHTRGVGPFEVADGAGQVREWTDTAEGALRVVVGSSWREPLVGRGDSPRRLLRPGARSLTLGFRCVRDVER